MGNPLLTSYHVMLFIRMDRFRSIFTDSNNFLNNFIWTHLAFEKISFTSAKTRTFYEFTISFMGQNDNGYHFCFFLFTYILQKTTSLFLLHGNIQNDDLYRNTMKLFLRLFKRVGHLHLITLFR